MLTFDSIFKHSIFEFHSKLEIQNSKLTMSGTLSIVATPIGNLSDITLRALETLKSVDAILCEDTRVTGKLLAHYQIKKPLISCHEHTDSTKLQHLVDRMKNGERLAFVSDAGTPGLSDPGNKLVSLASENQVNVVPIPGVSALTTLVSVAGIDMREFLFLGFPPHKKGRETFFKKVAASEIPVIYYESPHRVLKNLALLQSLTPSKEVIVGRELTKLFEELQRGTLSDVISHYQENEQTVKGEFTVIVFEKK